MISIECGLRAAEVFNLTWSCIYLEEGKIYIKDPKNKRNRWAFMTSLIKEMFEKKLIKKDESSIFLNKKGETITQVSKTFPRIVEFLGFNKFVRDRRERVVFHTLRHTFASRLMEDGADLYSVKELMGHSSITMTERYSHLGNNKLKSTIDKFDKNRSKMKL